VLNDGVVVEEGNHESLFAKSGAYRELYEKQMLGDDGSQVDVAQVSPEV